MQPKQVHPLHCPALQNRPSSGNTEWLSQKWCTVSRVGLSSLLSAPDTPDGKQYPLLLTLRAHTHTAQQHMRHMQSPPLSSCRGTNAWPKTRLTGPGSAATKNAAPKPQEQPRHIRLAWPGPDAMCGIWQPRRIRPAGSKVLKQHRAGSSFQSLANIQPPGQMLLLCSQVPGPSDVVPCLLINSTVGISEASWGPGN